MTATATEELSELADRYLKVWNEPDPRARAALVAELWAEEAVELTDQDEYHGRLALEERVAAAYRQFVEGGEFVFRLEGQPAAHHDAVTLGVAMIPTAGGLPVWIGTAFLFLDDRGRIEREYQFGRYLDQP
jgi:hypothetical protein